VRARSARSRAAAWLGRRSPSRDRGWNTDDVEQTYQWLRDGEPITGASAASHLLAPADLGRSISVAVTGTKEGWTSATVDSNALTTTVGDAIVATLQPRVSGTPALGQTLTATPGTWGTGETPAFGYQWLRDGGPITGATQASYVVTLADLGRDLSLRVTATRTAYAPGSFTTAGLPVARVATSTTAKAARKKIRQGRAGVRRIPVAAGAAGPARAGEPPGVAASSAGTPTSNAGSAGTAVAAAVADHPSQQPAGPAHAADATSAS